MAEKARQCLISALVCGIFVLSSCTTPPVGEGTGAVASDTPPPAPREFRAAWVATVANIDWPSKRGLPVEQQKREIVQIVERARELNLNALIVQVRPSADAIYPSNFEPWTEYLTGETGKPPQPFYDPLQMWIEESHSRGIELHAWFNPYRARHTSAKSAPSRDHIANTHPAVVKDYGGYLWMDPGEALAAQRTLDVILDVVKRYDIDGVHIDDYFYPYPVTDPPAATPAVPKPVEIDFPDDAAWSAYLLGGGKLARADWRRQNVDKLIEKIYRGIHGEKSWVKFGISPFGIGRPDRRPAGIAGFSQYDKLYADVELWLREGWLDYFVPQLYWPIDQAAQSYPVLLDYWIKENTKGRHVWPGLFTSRIEKEATAKSWKVDEVINQIAVTRLRGAADPLVRGHVHFSMVSLTENRQGLNEQLKRAYPAPAITPAMPWLGNERPAAPKIASVTRQASGAVAVDVNVSPTQWQFAVWARYATTWRFIAMPSAAASGKAEPGVQVLVLPADPALGSANLIVLSALDRAGNESTRVTIGGDGMVKTP
ncbi:MAG: family 10 glycosylhydrolase [Betaproteobacteria bacterium]|nr:family 10 glycosylhydrolase [Betaproteobacteria bacterium]